MLGDSIAAGAPVRGDDRWWRILHTLLQADHPEREVVVDSWAVSGSRVDVLQAAAEDQPSLGSYDVAIVIEGVNDVGVTDVAQWCQHYASAIEVIERRGPVVVVATPPPSYLDGAFTPRYDAIAAAIRDVAGSVRPLIDLAMRWRDDGPSAAQAYYFDQIHQSRAGQQVMAQLAHAVINEVIAPGR